MSILNYRPTVYTACTPCPSVPGRGRRLPYAAIAKNIAFSVSFSVLSCLVNDLVTCHTLLSHCISIICLSLSLIISRLSLLPLPSRLSVSGIHSALRRLRQLLTLTRSHVSARSDKTRGGFALAIPSTYCFDGLGANKRTCAAQ